MNFASLITRFPLPLDLSRAATAREAVPAFEGALETLVAGTAGSSPYLASLILREAEWLQPALLAPALSPQDLVKAETLGFGDLDADLLGAGLRRAKRRIALYTALADLGGVWHLEDVTAALTVFADRAVDLALRRHIATEQSRGKLPPTTADAGGIIALAMGKGGAGELNYSSDIDLIVLFDETAYASEDQQEARASLIRATKKAVGTLSDNTAEGYVFRTDLRLRPDASVTPVCISTGAALAYYEAEGRTWERAAYIKARPAAGNLAAGARFLHELRPFIWRRHLDFATIQDTQDMRLRIRDHKGLHGRITAAGHNMKLGQGGIREIEFFTQTRQLISGGRDPDLRVPTTVGGLAALASKGWIAPEIAQELTDHYREHREIEHRIQMLNDAQTHDVPTTPEGIDAVARLMGWKDTAAWCDRLEARLKRVEELTNDFFAPAETHARPSLSDHAESIVARWRHYPALRTQRARSIFERIEADLLTRMTRAADPDGALVHFDAFLAKLPAGVQLFSLFEANAQLIDLIVDICSTAPGLARYLARHPEVLDAVLGGSFFADWPGQKGLSEALKAQINAVLSAPGGGYEQALDAVRRWTHEWQFRTGVHLLRGLIGAEEAGQHYADIADTVLDVLFPIVAQEFSRRHGSPPGRGAVLVGMGSLGARLLNAGSDLDLLVIYDHAGQDASEGDRPLAARAYFSRLTQAMITAVSAPTAAGRAYEVDMRLRPSGRQGPVATSLQSFRDYQMTEAWTWEHLALTRARVVSACGADGEALAHDFEALRVEILLARGKDARVLPDLADMRERIFNAKADEGEWGAKIGRGRLQDVELFAQSCALRTAAPARAVVAQLRAGQRAQIVSQDDANSLGSAFRFLWSLQCAGRLLSDVTPDLDTLGQGARDLILRETGAGSIAELSARLSAIVEEAGGIIERELTISEAS